MRILGSFLLKLTRRPATLRWLLVLAAFLAFIYVSIGVAARTQDASQQAQIAPMLTFPDAASGLAGMLLIFGGMAGAAYAGAVAGSEWSWGTFRVAITRGESRIGYVLWLFLGIALLAVIAWAVLTVWGILVVLLASAISGIGPGTLLDSAGLGRWALPVALGAWGLLMEIAIGFGIAFVARSQVAGIATVVGLFLAEQFAASFVPAELLRFAPMTAASRLLSATVTSSVQADLGVPLGVTTLYLLAAVALAAITARRAEVL
jgi:hypothetical protein